MGLHPLRNAEILGTMIASDATWYTVLRDRLQEQSEHRLCPVVGVDTDTSDKAGVTVNEAVGHEFPADKT